VVARGRRGEIGLLLGATAFCLVLGEVAARLLAPDGRRASGYAPRFVSKPENSRGYRDVERELAKAPGSRRALALGDSFTWGVGVEFDDTWPRRVERTLARRRSEPWEVVSLALRGMNTVDQAAQLESEGFAYGPDVVVVAYVLNDSEDANAAEARRAEEWRAPRNAPGGPLRRSALFRFVEERLWASAENRRRIDGFRSMYRKDAPGWLGAQQALARIGARCREHGVPLVVAVFPLFGNPLHEGYPFASLHGEVARAAEAAGARVVDLLPFYRGLRWEVLVVDGADDEHPNEIAHRIAASAIADAVDAVVPRPAPR
jgi:hypothetical protein